MGDRAGDGPGIPGSWRLHLEFGSRDGGSSWQDAVSRGRSFVKCSKECLKESHPDLQRSDMSWGTWSECENWKYAWEIQNAVPRRKRQLDKFRSAAPEPEGHSRQSFTRFNDLPTEIQDEIFLLSIDPEIVSAHIYDCTDEERWNKTHHALFGTQIIVASWYVRKFAHIPLYAICRQSRALARTYFGEPSPNSIPFNPATDTLGLLGNGHQQYPMATRGNAWPCSAGFVMAPSQSWRAAIYMFQPLAERIRKVRIDTWFAFPTMALARNERSEYGSWGIIFRAIRDYLPNMTHLRLDMVCHDECISDWPDTAKQPLDIYLSEHLLLFDDLARLSPVAEDPAPPFPRLAALDLAFYAADCEETTHRKTSRDFWLAIPTTNTLGRERLLAFRPGEVPKFPIVPMTYGDVEKRRQDAAESAPERKQGVVRDLEWFEFWWSAGTTTPAHGSAFRANDRRE